MNPSLRFLLLPGAFAALASTLHAHPGHEGHELTWDFGHLAAHPLATIGCLAVFAAAGWLGWVWVKQAASRRSELVKRDRRG